MKLLLIAFICLIIASSAMAGDYKIIAGVTGEYTSEGVKLDPLYSGHFGIASKVKGGPWGQLYAAGEYQYSKTSTGADFQFVYFPSINLKTKGVNIGFLLSADIDWPKVEPNPVAYATGSIGLFGRYAINDKFMLGIPFKLSRGDKYNSVTIGFIGGFSF